MRHPRRYVKLQPVPACPRVQGFRHVLRECVNETTLVWRNDAAWRMVGATAVRISGAVDVSRIFNLGCISGNPLLARTKWRPLSFAIVFARNFRRFAARDFWTETRLVAIIAAIFSSPFGSVGARRFPAHLLLLPRRLLQSVLGGPARLCGG